jgi:ComF family protein
MPDIRQLAQGWFDHALDLVFPPRCVHCKRSGAVWCLDCQRAVTLAFTVEYEAADSPLAGRRAYALFDGSVQSAIHGLKYYHKQRLAEPLGVRLAETLMVTGWQPTLCTAVPLHAERLAERGYNQSVLLAEQVARICRITFEGDAIQRIRATRPQVGLNYADRQRNMTDAFRASTLVHGQSVVIIDDVYTTGATLRACANVLRSAGATAVWALTVASAASMDTDRRDDSGPIV